MQSGLAYTILRPGRLTDGPYTSYDLNTLLQATAGNRQDIQVAAKDELNGETSRIALAGIQPFMTLNKLSIDNSTRHCICMVHIPYQNHLHKNCTYVACNVLMVIVR